MTLDGRGIARMRRVPEKQKAGKKKIRQFGRVPQEAFINALKMDDARRTFSPLATVWRSKIKS